jgi:hypothetical protein
MIDDAAGLYNLPDLRAAIADYTNFRQAMIEDGQCNTLIGGIARRAYQWADVPYTAIRTWHRIKVQNWRYHPEGHGQDVAMAETVYAQPPSGDWPTGRYYHVLLIDNEDESRWPAGGNISGR